MDRHVAYSTHQKQAVAQAETALRREYGNQYEQAVGQAKSALAQYADPEYLQFLEQSGQGNDPRVIRAWIKVGKEMSGDTKLKGTVQQTAQPADLDALLNEPIAVTHEDLPVWWGQARLTRLGEGRGRRSARPIDERL